MFPYLIQVKVVLFTITAFHYFLLSASWLHPSQNCNLQHITNINCTVLHCTVLHCSEEQCKEHMGKYSMNTLYILTKIPGKLMVANL